MSCLRNWLLATTVAAVGTIAYAQTVKIEDPWVRGTVAQQKATGAFMRLTAPEPMRLIDAASPVAGVVEIHEMALENNVMKMRQIPGLGLPAGRPIELKPGGYHIMLMELKEPLTGERVVPLTLVFETADKRRIEQQVQAPVRPLGSSASSGHAGHHGHSHEHKH